MPEIAPAPKKGCAKRGCFGCLIVFGGLVGVLLVLALITVIRGTPEVIRENAETTHDIPRVEGQYEDTGGQPLVIDTDQAGRVVLDVSLVTFSIVPAPPGTPVRLDARYDSGKYRLKESMQPEGELGWTYRIDFGRRSMFDFIHTPDNRLTLYLPAGTPIVLEGTIGVGESDMQLGGLWIESVELDVGVGEHKMDFDEPLAAPMSSFKWSGSIGEARIRNLGNASPAEIDIGHRIGEIRVGLDGAWQNDADVRVRSSIGALMVGLPPESIALDLLRAGVGIGESNTRRVHQRGDPPPGAPVLRLKASHSLGELRLTD